MLVTALPRYIHDGDILLRPMRVWDGPFVSIILQRGDILKSSGVRKLRTTPWFLLYLWLRRTFFAAYCIERNARTIGFIGIYNLVPGRSAEISLAIFDPADRRKRAGSRACQALCRSFFSSALGNTLIARVRNDNAAARGFWSRLGFETTHRDGDVLVMELPGTASETDKQIKQQGSPGNQ
jgi:ribosomal protein S18 acetylase RimI-like enzyme